MNPAVVVRLPVQIEGSLRGADHDRAEDVHRGRAGGRPALRRAQPQPGQCRTGAADHRVTDGRGRLTTLAGHFADRTVVTYDPRSSGRSKRTDGASETTPDEHADDLHRLISALDAGPVDIFASSGGAVNALVLVAQHPEQVRTLVAHEPPASQEVPDREPVLAACHDIRSTYLSSGFGPAMAKFIKLVSYEGPLPADYVSQPRRTRPCSGCPPTTTAPATTR